MTDEPSNIVPFVARPATTLAPQEPVLHFDGMALSLETLSITIFVSDQNGDQHSLDYRLANVSKGFDLEDLRKAWPIWKSSVERAS